MPDRGGIAIIGATGQVGKAACRHLHARNQPFVALLRQPDTRNKISGVEQRQADMDQPETLETALTDVHRLLICGPDHPNLVRREAAVLSAAKSAGVEYVIKLSAQCGSLNPPAGFGIRHALAERQLQESGLPHLILSPMFFAQSVFLFGESLSAGKLRLPLTTGRVCYVDAVDVGEAAGNCLLDPPAENTRYILSGPESLSVPEVLAVLSDAIGKNVSNSAMPKFLIPFVLPVVAGMNYRESVLLKELLIALDDNAQNSPTQTLTELLGRPANNFDEVARRWVSQSSVR
jgi:uncharacterized protein YbjT (DUF2867 family)